MTPKDIAFAALGFVVPVVLCFGWVAVATRGGEIRTNMNTIGSILIWSAPVIGYAFISHPLWRWAELDRSAKRLCVGMSGLYWLLYIPALYVCFVVYALGRFGGT